MMNLTWITIKIKVMPTMLLVILFVWKNSETNWLLLLHLDEPDVPNIKLQINNNFNSFVFDRLLFHQKYAHHSQNEKFMKFHFHDQSLLRNLVSI